MRGCILAALIAISVLLSNSAYAQCIPGWGLCPGGYCAPLASVCCGNGRYCPRGTSCGSRGTCLSVGHIDCGDGQHCRVGTRCARSGCIPHDAVDCGRHYCPAGSFCSPTGCTSQNAPDTSQLSESSRCVIACLELSFPHRTACLDNCNPSTPTIESSTSSDAQTNAETTSSTRSTSTSERPVTNSETVLILLGVSIVAFALLALLIQGFQSIDRAPPTATATQYAAQLRPGEILVRERLSGQIGAIPEAEYDATIYERV
jgi:hypothetical protein